MPYASAADKAAAQKRYRENKKKAGTSSPSRVNEKDNGKDNDYSKLSYPRGRGHILRQGYPNFQNDIAKTLFSSDCPFCGSRIDLDPARSYRFLKGSSPCRHFQGLTEPGKESSFIFLPKGDLLLVDQVRVKKAYLEGPDRGYAIIAQKLGIEPISLVGDFIFKLNKGITQEDNETEKDNVIPGPNLKISFAYRQGIIRLYRKDQSGAWKWFKDLHKGEEYQGIIYTWHNGRTAEEEAGE